MFYDGYPIYLATKEHQMRKHGKNCMVIMKSI